MDYLFVRDHCVIGTRCSGLGPGGVTGLSPDRLQDKVLQLISAGWIGPRRHITPRSPIRFVMDAKNP